MSKQNNILDDLRKVMRPGWSREPVAVAIFVALFQHHCLVPTCRL